MFRLENSTIVLFGLFGVFAVCLLASPRSARASGEQRQALAELAKDVKKFLDDKGAQSIVIAEFKATGAKETGAGPSFTFILAEELAKLGVKIEERGKFWIKGKYLLAEVPATTPDDARIG